MTIGGQAIAAQALGHAGLRVLASEQGGPRPAGTPSAATGGVHAGAGARAVFEDTDLRTVRATRP